MLEAVLVSADAQSRGRVLLVEDESMVAMLIEDMVADLGWEVVAVATRVEEALEIAATKPFDFAILDVNLAGTKSFPVAEALRARRIPFVFATGYGSAAVENLYRGTPTLQKPFHQHELARAITDALAV